MLNKIGKIVLLVLIFVGGFAVGLASKYYIDEWRAKRNVVLWMDSLDPFKNDTYGGATPEETFDLYLSALKKGDLELASRYFLVTKQMQEIDSLNKKNSENKLSDYIKKLENVKNVLIKKQDNFYNWIDKAALEYKTIVSTDEYVEFKNPKTGKVEKILIPRSEYKELIEFQKINNIWKLYLL